jgi:hypothetical protein
MVADGFHMHCASVAMKPIIGFNPNLVVELQVVQVAERIALKPQFLRNDVGTQIII